MHALVRARIPYVPIDVDDIGRDASIRTVILPNIGALSDAQAAVIRRFVTGGGSVVATGATGLYTEWGDPRPDFALADLFGCHRAAEPLQGRAPRGGGSLHTYLRLPTEGRSRHEVLHGFDGTDVVAFGGTLTPLPVDAGATAVVTFVPPFPTYPPETAWMRQPSTDIPGLLVSEHGRSRVAYLPADLDRRYAAEHLPDHARLLANVVRWAAGATIPLDVKGTGLIDCHLYAQPGRLILHLVNLTSEATWRAPLDELIRVGPFDVSLLVPTSMPGPAARLLVSGGRPPVSLSNGRATFRVDAIDDHEVVVVE